MQSEKPVRELTARDVATAVKTNGERTGRDQADVHARALAWFSVGLGVAELAAPGVIARLIGARPNQRTRRLLRALGLREIGSGLGIFSRSHAPGWVWSRVVGDAIDLALLGEVFAARQSTRARTLTAIAAVAGVSVLDALTAIESIRNNGHSES
jgi:hypothetical protein